MNQVLQNLRTGRLTVTTVPEPLAQPGQVLIANAASVISAGTEKMVIELAQKSLLTRARERPDQLRRVLEKIRNEGLFHTVRQVFAKLDEPVTMGYASAGVVLACGARVQEFKPGDRVASNGPHAGVVSVPRHLCAKVPDSVPLAHAAFTVLGSIALQSVRLARVELGGTALVIGLGLVGQLTVALLRAAGVRVLGTDPDASKCELALRMGAAMARPGLGAAEVAAATGNLLTDAVLITASTQSNQPIELAAESVRKKGRIVLVGVVGLQLDRRPFYFKECEFVVSCSYGPGRYDPEYEERGRDYPAAYVRWTEQRNLQAILDLMASSQLDIGPLISHRFPIDRAAEAYALIESNSKPYLGIVLEYPEVTPDTLTRRVELRAAKAHGTIGYGCLGAGNFARQVLLPALRQVKGLHPVLLCSAGGTSASHAGSKFEFEAATTDPAAVYGDDRVQAIFILTRHDQHGQQVVEALRAGKHVFTEKPLCLTVDELTEIEAVLNESGQGDPLLMVGFNRRFAPASLVVKQFFQDHEGPLTISIRFNAGAVAADHWTQDEEIGGGRLIGEACHAIDLATYLAGAPPVRVYAESVGSPHAEAITDDQCFITLRHANGSISSVAYMAGGDKAFPKERVEVMGGGRVAVIEDFREVVTCRGGRTKRTARWSQDKGHAAEVLRFAEALVKGGPAPISWDELRAVTLAALLAVRSLRESVPFDIS
jgi:predicted dehydrogenase/threonine dehydrogenase-like Zn-dependent dehydrogenase